MCLFHQTTDIYMKTSHVSVELYKNPKVKHWAKRFVLYKMKTEPELMFYNLLHARMWSFMIVNRARPWWYHRELWTRKSRQPLLHVFSNMQQERKLNSFPMRCFRSICGCRSLFDYYKKRRCRIGNVRRLSECRLPRKHSLWVIELLNSGTRNIGRPLLRFRAVVLYKNIRDSSDLVFRLESMCWNLILLQTYIFTHTSECLLKQRLIANGFMNYSMSGHVFHCVVVLGGVVRCVRRVWSDGWFISSSVSVDLFPFHRFFIA